MELTALAAHSRAGARHDATGWRETFIWTARGMGMALGVVIVVGLGFLALRATNVLILALARLQAREVPVAQESSGASADSPESDDDGLDALLQTAIPPPSRQASPLGPVL